MWWWLPVRMVNAVPNLWAAAARQNRLIEDRRSAEKEDAESDWRMRAQNQRH
jgi:hypothetical protein